MFLAAIMIVSVFGMSAAFAGTAAAYDGDFDDDDAFEITIEDDTIDADEEVTTTVTVDVLDHGDVDEGEVEEIDINNPSEGDDAGVQSPDFDAGTEELDVTLNPDGDESNFDLTVTVAAEDDGDHDEDFVEELPITVEEPDTVDDTQEYDDDGPVWVDGEDGPVYIGQEVTIVSEEFAEQTNGDTADDVSAVILYEGPESLDEDDRTHVTSIEIQDDDDYKHPYGEFETDDLEPGEAYHFHIGGEGHYAFDGEEFWTDEEDLDADFGVNTVPQDDTAEIEFESERDDMFLNVTSEDVDGDDLEDYVESTSDIDEYEAYTDDVLTLEGVDDGAELEIDFDEFDTGTYEFEFESTDSFAWDNATVEVTDEDTGVYFADDPMGEQGDMIEIVLEPEHTEEGAVQVGNWEDDYYQSTVEFEIDTADADEIVLLFDTDDPEDPWNVPEEYEDDYDLDTPNDATFTGWDTDDEDVLGVYDYEMTSGTSYESLDYGDDDDNVPASSGDAPSEADGDGDFATVAEDDETDTTFLRVTEPETISDVTLERAPHDTDFDDADDLEEAYEDDLVTEDDVVAHGDELLLILEDFGMSGAVDDENDATAIFEDAGMNVTIEEEDPGPNQDAAWWTTYEVAKHLDDYEGDDHSDNDVAQLETSNVIQDFNEYDGDLVLQIDYEDMDMPGDRSADDDAEGLDFGEYEITFEATDDSIFVDDDEDAIEFTTEFDLEEPELDLHPDNDEVPNSDSAEVTGTSNIAPGAEIGTDAASEGNFTDSEDTIVDADGTFTAVYDFTEYDAATPFELDAEADETTYDDRGDAEDDMDAVLVAAEDPLINFDAAAPGDVEPGDAASLDVTVSNDGGASDDVDVTVTIDGDDVTDETITVDAGDEWSESFDFDTADEADIDWDVTVDDESDSGTLTVAEEEDPVDEDEDPVDEDEDPEDEEEEPADDDETPGFGVAVAVVALLAAAMLALRRQN
ncbi:hypothetical protein C490_09388 [Natronobacterium gregoryi SP2]|uniref:PGF-CTERM archaeal protein-sorting signal domain-containing protein n=1 Tax=Natronobacterium gregoryi (strain ATCC 43098 / DSM 3393 / CCM 3738 / CIP 104747 / IAM 13177 / JCM 8860 / NBRC 102187 / NCIMB 2189 / SP2) TaxID=797304 RepID=L9Y4M9_NATGS|nr:hypothetical protein C490_09388 [Natronobacterium gregoryi SP2]